MKMLCIGTKVYPCSVEGEDIPHEVFKCGDRRIYICTSCLKVNEVEGVNDTNEAQGNNEKVLS